MWSVAFIYVPTYYAKYELHGKGLRQYLNCSILYHTVFFILMSFSLLLSLATPSVFFMRIPCLYGMAIGSTFAEQAMAAVCSTHDNDAHHPLPRVFQRLDGSKYKCVVNINNIIRCLVPPQRLPIVCARLLRVRS